MFVLPSKKKIASRILAIEMQLLITRGWNKVYYGTKQKEFSLHLITLQKGPIEEEEKASCSGDFSIFGRRHIIFVEIHNKRLVFTPFQNKYKDTFRSGA